MSNKTQNCLRCTIDFSMRYICRVVFVQRDYWWRCCKIYSFWYSWKLCKIYGEILGPPSNFFVQLMLMFNAWMVALSSCLIWQIIIFNLLLNEYDCVYAWTMLGKWACDRPTEDADSGKKSSFQMKLILILAGM